MPPTFAKISYMSKVKENDTVKVHYTGKLENGDVFDSSVDREPLEFTVGQGQMIPGFEKGVMDMAVDEKKTLHIPSAEAYGEHNPEMTQEVAKSQLPEDLKPEVGQKLVSQTPDGKQFQVEVTEVKDEAIVVDANHPLAGKDLIFDIQLIEIK